VRISIVNRGQRRAQALYPALRDKTLLPYLNELGSNRDWLRHGSLMPDQITAALGLCVEHESALL